MRINKYFSQQGICSRREAEDYIRKGKVMVNGEIIHDLGRQVDPGKDDVKLIGKKGNKTTVLVYKPRGILTGLKPSGKIKQADKLSANRYTKRWNSNISHDKEEGKSIFDLLPQFSNLSTIGRLDKDSQGLIILSNDGILTKVLTSEDHIVPKEYLVTVRETIMPGMIKRLTEGVELKDGMTLPTVASKIDDHTFSIELKEGRKHQIRRMANAVNLTITKLERVRIGNISKGALRSGQYRTLTRSEIKELKNWE